MKPGDRRRMLRARRQQLRADMALMRQQARARCEPLLRPRKLARRRRRIIAGAALLLMAWLLRCEPEVAPPAKQKEVATRTVPKPASPPRKVAPAPSKETDRIVRRSRKTYETSVPAPPTWIDELRLQAAARSPRLAQCFEGTERPGAVRWMAALDPETGTVSEHELEPLGADAPLTAQQRACVARALSSPRYQLTGPPLQPFPERVTLVIEF
jgi:hypothetical protein